MEDKVQLIKEEIERLKTQNETYLDKEYAESTKWYKHGAYDICFQLLNFIDTLPEEPASEELESIVEQIADPTCIKAYGVTELANRIRKSVLQMHASEDLEEEIDRFEEWLNSYNQSDYPTSYTVRDIARHFAEWQKQQMNETLQAEYEKGRFDIREEMMKDAQFGIIEERADGLLGWNTIYGTDKDYRNYLLSNFKNGDEVKIIFVKEDR